MRAFNEKKLNHRDLLQATGTGLVGLAF